MTSNIKTKTPAKEAPTEPFKRAVAVCVRAAQGLEPPPVTPAESLRVLRTVFACYRAAETGRAQAVPAGRD